MSTSSILQKMTKKSQDDPIEKMAKRVKALSDKWMSSGHPLGDDFISFIRNELQKANYVVDNEIAKYWATKVDQNISDKPTFKTGPLDRNVETYNDLLHSPVQTARNDVNIKRFAKEHKESEEDRYKETPTITRQNFFDEDRPKEHENYDVTHNIDDNENLFQADKTLFSMSKKHKSVKANYFDGPPQEMTRYCPDHDAALLARVSDKVYQCNLDGAIYDYASGFTTQSGKEVPGAAVAVPKEYSFYQAPHVWSFSNKKREVKATDTRGYETRFVFDLVAVLNNTDQDGSSRNRVFKILEPVTKGDARSLTVIIADTYQKEDERDRLTKEE